MTEILLYPLKIKDINDDYIKALNNPEINKYLSTKRASLKSVKEYINKIKFSYDEYIYGIFKGYNRYGHLNLKLVGTCTIKNIDREFARGTIGVLVWEMNKGYGTLALKQLSKIAKKLGLKELVLGVDINNVGAIKCYEKSGYKKKQIMMSTTI